MLCTSARSRMYSLSVNAGGGSGRNSRVDDRKGGHIAPLRKVGRGEIRWCSPIESRNIFGSKSWLRGTGAIIGAECQDLSSHSLTHRDAIVLHISVRDQG